MAYYENIRRGILVDQEDMYWLEKYLFNTHNGYAYTRIDNVLCSLHHLILPGVELIDHINRNKLDNRKANLRSASVAQNNQNVGKTKANTSGYKGVSEHGGSWRYEITAHGLRERVSGYKTAQQAAVAYNAAARKYHGDFCYQNEIEGWT